MVRGGRTHIGRRPFFAGGVRQNVLGIGGAYGWTQDVLIYFKEAQNWYKSMQAKFTRRFSDGWSAQVNYTLQKVEGEQDKILDLRSRFEQGPFRLRSDAQLHGRDHLRTAVRQGQEIRADGRGHGGLLGGWQAGTNVFILSGTPFEVSYRDASLDRDTGPNRPDLIGDPQRPAETGATGGSTRRPSARLAAPSADRRGAPSAICRATTCEALASGRPTCRSSRTSGWACSAASRSESKR